MKTINISKKKFETLKELDLSKDTFNTEGKMFHMRYSCFVNLHIS